MPRAYAAILAGPGRDGRAARAEDLRELASAQRTDAGQGEADEGATAALHLGCERVGGRLLGREPRDLEGVLARLARAGDGNHVCQRHGVLAVVVECAHPGQRSEEHTSELQSLMRSSYAVFCLKT